MADTANSSYAAATNDLRAGLERLVGDVGVGLRPQWGTAWHTAGCAADIAVMCYQAGVRLLTLDDPVARAAGMRWVAIAFEHCHLNLGLDDSTYRFMWALNDPRFAIEPVADWPLLLLAVVADAERQRPAETSLLIWGPELTARLLGEAVARCLAVSRVASTGSGLLALRHRAGRSVGRAASACSMSPHQWRYAEIESVAELDEGTFTQVMRVFDVPAGRWPDLAEVSGWEALTSRWLGCGAHPVPADVEPGDKVFWDSCGGERVVDRFAPGIVTFECSDPTCERWWATGAMGLYLLPFWALVDGTQREQAQTWARHLLAPVA